MQTPGERLGPWKSFWTRQKPVQRALLVSAVLALALLPLWLSGRPAVETARIDLFESPLSRAEQGRVRLALTEAGISGFALEQDRLWVEPQTKSSCLKILNKAGAIPQRWMAASHETELPSVNPFLSRSQQDLIHQQHRQQQIRRLLLDLPFVEEARVQIDSRESGSAFDSPDLCCVVSIQPHHSFVLDCDEVATIHQNVVQAIAGIRPEKVLVNDLNAGFCWNLARIERADNGSMAMKAGRLKQNRWLEYRLKTALHDLPGVAVETRMPEVETAAQQAALPMLGPGDFTLPRARPGDAPVLSVVGPGTNDSVKVMPPDFSPSPDQQDGAADRVEVSIEIPPEAVQQFMLRSPGLNAAGNEPSAEGAGSGAAGLEQFDDALRRELLERIEPILAAESLKGIDYKPVFHFENPVPVASVRGRGSNGSLWGLPGSRVQGALLAVGSGLGLGLLVVLSMRRRSPAAPARAITPPADRPDVWLDNSSDVENRERLRKQIDNLIDTDPDAAARVIQNWIRDAA